MKRKLIGFLAALVLAAIGTAALVTYVQSAKNEAVAGEALVDVYVVSDTIPKGTPVADITHSVKVAHVPAKVQVDDAVTDLDTLDDKLVAAVDLEPGEQLLSSRLVPANRLSRAAVPAGLQELTVSLDPTRAVGGSLNVGDTVGVVLSFEPFDLPDTDNQSPSMTHLTFHKVVVTAVQFAEGDGRSGSEEDDQSADDGTAADPAPANQVLVTLALSSPQVEQVVFAAEFGHIWLTAENADADESGTRVVTLGEAFGPGVTP
jgi:pilus assembly protein CpaB